jgi:hypothetical protein
VSQLNRNAVWALAVPGLAVSALLIFSACSGSPNDGDLIRRFEANKATYERLRDMLIADTNLKEVGPSGVEMADSPVFVTPPTPIIAGAHYQEYMDLLKLAGGIRASRSGGLHPSICIGVWANGLAADTKHKNICWLDDQSGDGRFNRKAIESNWFLEQD